MVKEQAEAEDGTSMQQRALKSTGTVVGGVGKVVGEDNKLAGGKNTKSKSEIGWG